MKKRKRPIPVMFWVSEDERAQIEEKMAQLGTGNMSAYLRKIAIDGFVVNLDLPELRELTMLLRRSSANLNQLTKLANIGNISIVYLDEFELALAQLGEAVSEAVARGR